MQKKAFRALHSLLRRDRMRCPAATIADLWFRPFGQSLAADRDHDNPRRFYLRLVRQQNATVSDRRFYVARARRIRLAKFATIHP